MLFANGTFHHVYDFSDFELPFNMSLPLPGITKFMVLQVVALSLTLWIFKGLAQQIQGGKPAMGWWWNFWEVLALYIRDEVVRPIIGEPHAPHGHDDHAHDDHAHGDHGHGDHGHVKTGAGALLKVGHPADRYLPYAWTVFFYILICNLLGAVPWLGSATGSVSVTIALALVAFCATYYYGAEAHGWGGFWLALVPSLDAPAALKPALWGMMFCIEIVGFFIKHAVLAVRLFANIMGGHTVLGVILSFIAATSHHGVWWVVAPGSIIGQIGVGMLELLVAFIQAYVFTFLSTIFIAMSLHEH